MAETWTVKKRFYTKEELEAMWSRAQVEEDGFINAMDVEFFHCILHAYCIYLGTDCPNSYDAAEAFQTADGQVLELCNPRQTAFAAFIR